MSTRGATDYFGYPPLSKLRGLAPLFVVHKSALNQFTFHWDDPANKIGWANGGPKTWLIQWWLSIIGPISVLAGASKWTIMFSLFFWHVHIHNDGPMKTARLHFISPNHIIYLQNKSYIYKHFQLLVTIRTLQSSSIGADSLLILSPK